MDICFVNNIGETFTPTKSGAIATWIWELCRIAQSEGKLPLVISRSRPETPYDWPRTVFLDYPTLPRNRVAGKLVYLHRDLTGHTHARQEAYMARVLRVIREQGAEQLPLVLNNDIEMAVFLRRHLPDAFILHNFQNNNTCSEKFRARFKASVNVATAVSDACARWNEEYFGFTEGGIKTLYSGVDTERFHPSDTLPSGPPFINFVGLTDHKKAPDLLLRAALKLVVKTKNFGIQILGSRFYGWQEMDDYQRQIEELAAQLETAGIEVRRPGFINRFDLPDALRRAQINVVPSRWDEPFGLVTPEGMACGLATVASRTGGTPEIVQDAGFLFEREDVDELAAHLERLVLSEELRREYSVRARTRALDFTWQKTWERLAFLINNPSTDQSRGLSA